MLVKEELNIYYKKFNVYVVKYEPLHKRKSKILLIEFLDKKIEGRTAQSLDK